MQVISHVQKIPNNTCYNLENFHNHGSIIGSPCYISFNKYNILEKVTSMLYMLMKWAVLIPVMYELVYLGSFAKSFVCHFYTTILVVWSSLDHSKENLEISTSFWSLTTS